MLRTISEILESFNLSHIKKYVIVGQNKKSKGIIADADDYFTAKRYQKILSSYFVDTEVLEYEKNIDYISQRFFSEL